MSLLKVRGTWRRVLAALAGVLIAACGATTSGTSSNSKKLDDLTVQMAYTWVSSQFYSTYLLGEQKGFYSRHGINAKFVEGTGSLTTVQLVANGKATIAAEVDTGATARAVAQGAQIKMVAATLPTNPLAVLSRGDNAINNPQQLIGKKIAIPPGTTQAQIWPAFLAKNHLTSAQVTTVSLPATAVYQALATKQIDGYVSFSFSNLPLLQALNLHPVAMLLSSYGITYTPGEGVVVQDSLIKNNPGLIRRFLLATQEAIQYSMKHPVEAAAAGVALQPLDLKQSNAESQIRAVAQQFVMFPPPAGKSLFYMRESQWASLLQLLTTYAGLTNAPKPTDCYTNALLPSSANA
ncbi:MAG: ABC transporter substrate-binding protein [Candidatus Dormibacteraceae bacterium]